MHRATAVSDRRRTQTKHSSAPMQIKTICSDTRSREDQRDLMARAENFNKKSQAPNGATSRAIGPHSMTIGAPRRAHPPDF